MKKIIACCLALLMITGCSKNVEKISDSSAQLLNDAIIKSKELKNYTKNETLEVKLEVDGTTNYDTTSVIESYINNNDNQNEAKSKMYVSVTGVGESAIQLWIKDGKFYIESDGSRFVQEGTFEEYESQLGESDFTKLIEGFDFLYGTEEKSGKNTILKFKLNETQIMNILASQGEIFEDVEYKENTNLMAFTIDENKYIVEIHLDLNIEIIEQDTIINSIVKLDYNISDINKTVVEFPENLAEFASAKQTNDDNQNELMKALMELYNYEEVEPGIIQYDWGSEIYEFNFNKKEFNLISEFGTYTYNWSDKTGYLGGVCTYNFDKSENIGCSDEETANIQLAKEIFDSECQASGVSPSSLN